MQIALSNLNLKLIQSSTYNRFLFNFGIDPQHLEFMVTIYYTKKKYDP